MLIGMFESTLDITYDDDLHVHQETGEGQTNQLRELIEDLLRSVQIESPATRTAKSGHRSVPGGRRLSAHHRRRSVSMRVAVAGAPALPTPTRN
jgi:hypothetical protein